jgi:DNA-binding beta-propeller fold protein YncE
LVTSFDNAVTFIDLRSNTVIFKLSTPFDFFPNGIAITPDGAFAYVTNFIPGAASIAKIDLATRTIVTIFPARGAFPQNVFITPDGAQLYVTYPFGAVVSIIDLLTNTEAFALSVDTPRGIAFNSQGTKAYIASAGGSTGTVIELNTDTFAIANRYTVGMGPNDVAVLYGDLFVAVTNYEGRSLSKIDTVSGTVQTMPVNGQASGLSIVY